MSAAANKTAPRSRLRFGEIVICDGLLYRFAGVVIPTDGSAPLARLGSLASRPGTRRMAGFRYARLSRVRSAGMIGQ